MQSLKLPRALSIFQIQGSPCCPKMTAHFESKALFKFHLVYDANHIFEANTLILWGSFSPKILELLSPSLSFMVNPRFIIHFRGCDLRLDNKKSSASLNSFISVNALISDCGITDHEQKHLIKEARTCLRV